VEEKHDRNLKEVIKKKARSVSAEGERQSSWTMSIIVVLPTRLAIICRWWRSESVDFKPKVGVVVIGLVAKGLGLG